MSCNPMDRLATVVEALGTANKAMRDVIQNKDDEIGRLEHFEEQFRSTEANFSQFKELAFRHEKDAESLQILLQQDLKKHEKYVEDLKLQIAQLKKAIDVQSLDNEKLESDLKDNVERLQKLNYSSRDQNGGDYATMMSSTNSNSKFIQRLFSDCK